MPRRKADCPSRLICPTSPKQIKFSDGIFLASAEDDEEKNGSTATKNSVAEKQAEKKNFGIVLKALEKEILAAAKKRGRPRKQDIAAKEQQKAVQKKVSGDAKSKGDSKKAKDATKEKNKVAKSASLPKKTATVQQAPVLPCNNCILRGRNYKILQKDTREIRMQIEDLKKNAQRIEKSKKQVQESIRKMQAKKTLREKGMRLRSATENEEATKKAAPLTAKEKNFRQHVEAILQENLVVLRKEISETIQAQFSVLTPVLKNQVKTALENAMSRDED